MPQTARFFQKRPLPNFAHSYGKVFFSILFELTNIHNGIEKNLQKVDRNILVQREGNRIIVYYKDLVFISQHLCMETLEDFGDFVLQEYPDYRVVQDYAMIGYCFNIILRSPHEKKDVPACTN